MASERPADFRLAGRWLIQPTLYRVVDGEATHTLGPKVMEVLTYLAQRPGEIVPREALMAAVWPETYVVEEALSRCISELRKCFGDSWQHPTVIETIRNVGYRLIATVEPVVEQAPPSAGATVAASSHTLSQGIGIAVILLAVLGIVGYVAPWHGQPEGSSLLWQPTRLTHYPGVEQDAAFSPDGQHVAFVWDSGVAGQADIYVQRIGAMQPTRLTHDATQDRHPVWSPDGTEVAFMRYAGSACALFAVTVQTRTTRSLGTCDDNHIPDLAWSPDGQWLAYSAYLQPNGPHRIVLHDVASGARRILTSPPVSRYGDYAPVFSPDGHSLAFTRMAFEEANDVYVIPIAGGEERRLTHHNRLIEGATWTPDSHRLLFTSNLRGVFDLWQVDVDDGATTWLAGDTEDILFPRLNPQGNRLLFEHFTTEPNLWQIDLADTNYALSSVVASAHWDVAPAIGPDGRIAFASNRSGHWELWLAEPNGSNPRPITRFAHAIVGAPRWSPDGTRLAFDARPDGHTDVHLLEIASGTVTRLTNLPSDEWAPTWAPDGQSLYFASDRSGTWQIWNQPVSSGLARQVTTDGGMFAQVSLDGQTLYFARNDVPGIWKQSVSGGSATRLFDALAPLDWANWAAADSAIYFIRRSKTASFIARYDLATGTYRDLAMTHATTPWQLMWSQPAFSLSPDGTRALFTQIDRRESDLMLVESIDW